MCVPFCMKFFQTLNLGMKEIDLFVFTHDDAGQLETIARDGDLLDFVCLERDRSESTELRTLRFKLTKLKNIALIVKLDS